MIREASVRNESMYGLFRENLHERCFTLEREGRLDLAQTVKKEIEFKVKKSQEERLGELKAKQENDRAELENNHINEFQDFNAKWEKRLEDHHAKANELVDTMLEKHKNDRMQLNEHLENTIPKNPKNSSELLNMLQIKKGLIKLKEYGEAHKVEQRINMLTKKEAENWETEKRKKIGVMLNHFDDKSENELRALKKRLNATEDEMKKARSIEMEQLLQKFQNIKKELQNYQIQEINKFNLSHFN